MIRTGPGLFALALALGACALPGRTDRISPPISGRFADGAALAGHTLRLVAHNVQSDLAARAEVEVGPDGDFAFEALGARVFGKEYGQGYRAFLSVLGAGPDGEQILWRAEYSRMAIDAPVELDCDRDRAPTVGQPCQVRAPTRQVWLVRAGARDFRRLCASCHGRKGSGGGPAAAALRSSPADLTRIAARRGGSFPRDEIAEWIEGQRIPTAHGTREMPIWGEELALELERYTTTDQMVGARIDGIVTYLETIQVD